MSRCRLGVSVEAVSSRSSCHHLEPEVHSKDFLKDFFFFIVVFVSLHIRPVLAFHSWADCIYVPTCTTDFSHSVFAQ